MAVLELGSLNAIGMMEPIGGGDPGGAYTPRTRRHGFHGGERSQTSSGNTLTCRGLRRLLGCHGIPRNGAGGQPTKVLLSLRKWMSSETREGSLNDQNRGTASQSLPVLEPSIKGEAGFL